MTTTEQPAAIDMDKLMGFLFQTAGDIGATLNTALVAGESRRDVVTRGDLTRFRRASETLINVVYEARP